MDIQGLTIKATTVAVVPGSAGPRAEPASTMPMAAAGDKPAATVDTAAAPTTRSPSAVEKPAVDQAVQTLQRAAERHGASVALSAGLDPNGDHPGQVLIELKDTVTKQVFYQRYVPADQVVEATQAEGAAGKATVAPGAIISGKA